MDEVRLAQKRRIDVNTGLRYEYLYNKNIRDVGSSDVEKEGLYQVSINKRGNVVEIINALIHLYEFFKKYVRG